MAYLPEERETVIRYDELDNCWYFESNVRRHVTKILKNDFCISVRAKLSNLDDFLVSPFVRKKVKLTEEQKQERAERLKSILS